MLFRFRDAVTELSAHNVQLVFSKAFLPMKKEISYISVTIKYERQIGIIEICVVVIEME